MRTKEGQTILAFRGLPYAKPPVGNGRWEKWTHTIFLSLILMMQSSLGTCTCRNEPVHIYLIYILSLFPSILLARCLFFLSRYFFSTVLYCTALNATVLCCTLQIPAIWALRRVAGDMEREEGVQKVSSAQPTQTRVEAPQVKENVSIRPEDAVHAAGVTDQKVRAWRSYGCFVVLKKK